MENMQEIAIIGIGCLFPGAGTPEQFWQNLWDNKDLTSLISSKEVGCDPMDYFNPEPGTPDTICYRKNGYIRGFKFDPHGYRIDPEKLMTLDNLFLWTLYAAKQALEDSGYLNVMHALNRCGIISGHLSFPTRYSKQMFLPVYTKALEPYVRTLLNNRKFTFKAQQYPVGVSPYNALTASFPTTITAKALGLQGQSYAVDAACSSALYCLKFAGYYLNSGKADLMLAGASCRPDPVFISHGFNMLQASPPDHGNCIPLDRASQGLNLGEGAAFFVLKRYDQAIRDGDKIYAVIENVGLSNDGGAQHILMPDKHGQRLALERAYRSGTRIVDYIECHATGTPLGDRVELDTLESFFKETDLPLFGANKAGIGHMLTASGMAGMIKVVLSMAKGKIPASPGIQSPITTKNNIIQAVHIAKENTEWQKKGGKKRAGVNAFGFGGTNAHVILREHTPCNQSNGATKSVSTMATKEKDAPIAIVGMNVKFGELDDLDAFARAVKRDTTHFTPLAPLRWIGAERHPDNLTFDGGEAVGPSQCAFFNAADIDCLRLKLPPKMINLPLANHLFMAQIAIKACDDAGLDRHKEHDGTAVIIAWEMDLAIHRPLTRSEIPGQLRRSLKKYDIHLDNDKRDRLETILKNALFPEPYLEGVTGGIGNLAASRIASAMGFRGPSFTIASQENSIFKAVELAKYLLNYETVDTVLIGGLDMAAGWEPVIWRSSLYGKKGNTRAQFRGRFGEGGGAIVLKRYKDAQEQGHRIYSKIDALSITQNHQTDGLHPTPLWKGVHDTCKNALLKAKIKPSDINYIELNQSGIHDEDEAEINGISKAYALEDTEDDKPATGSIKNNIGHTFTASGIAAIVKASILLYHGLLPKSSRTDKKRFIGVNGLGGDGSYSHLILAGVEQRGTRPGGQLDAGPDNSETQKKEKSFIIPLINGSTGIERMILKKENLEQFKTRKAIPFVVLSTAKKFKGVEHLPFVVLSTASDNIRKEDYSPTQTVLWDESELIELTQGLVSNVLGPDYKKADTYPVRARMPSSPFMFATRVIKMTAQKGQLKPCMIQWEYDIPKDVWYAANGAIPMIIPFEASHTLILMLSYIGCDEMFDGQLRYRALDSNVVIRAPMPVPGDTFVGEVTILSFVRIKSSLLISYEFNGFVKGEKLFTITANAGLFSTEAINKSQGLPSVHTADHVLPNKPFDPVLECGKNTFSDTDIKRFQAGHLQDCFGPGYTNQKSLILGVTRFLMLDRVVSIDPDIPNKGRGVIVGEKDINPDHWIFRAHFKNDPVLPGTMIILGIYQLLLFYMYYLGLHSRLSECRPSIMLNSTTKAKFRGEVKPAATQIRYRLFIKEINPSQVPSIMADAEVVHHDKVIGVGEDMRFVLTDAQEKSG